MYKRDPELFATFIVPFLKCKLDPDLVDLCLLYGYYKGYNTKSCTPVVLPEAEYLLNDVGAIERRLIEVIENPVTLSTLCIVEAILLVDVMRFTHLEKCRHLVELIKSEDFYNDYTGTSGNQFSKEALFDRIVRINLGVEEGKIAMENFNYVLGMKKINIESAPVNYSNAWKEKLRGLESDGDESDASSIPSDRQIVRNARRNREETSDWDDNDFAENI